MDGPSPGQLTLDRRTVVRVLVALTAALVVAGTVAALVLPSQVPFALDSLGRLVLLDAEANIASWWGSALLLGCAAGFLLASGALPAQRRRLRVLALLLSLLSLDESAIVHERASGALLMLITGSREDAPQNPLWVLAALPLVALTAWFVLPVLRSLPRTVRRRWWVAAVLYLGGAVGVEVVTNLLTGPGTTPYAFAVALEEGMEYAGAIVLLDSLLRLAGAAPRLRLTWAAGASGAYPAGSSSPSPRAHEVV